MAISPKDSHVMKCRVSYYVAIALVTVMCLLHPTIADTQAVVSGITGPTFNLMTGTATINTPDGDSLLIWCYGVEGEFAQYPGPTLIVNQGQTVTINLSNSLPQPVSMVFPGQGIVTASGDIQGNLTWEAAAGSGNATYSFVASNPGTFTYHSGTRPELQIEMGLVGAIIVRPANFNQSTNRTAYGHPDTAYDHEYLFLLSEMDPFIHDLVASGFADSTDNTSWDGRFWFINGRNAMDTLLPDNESQLPNQPYGALARTHPGETVLLRIIGGGRNLHSFHPHGNHTLLIARDGRMLESAPGSGPDLARADFTHTPTPGSTMDLTFDWTSKGLGWDIYGNPTESGFEHSCNGQPVNPTPGIIDADTGEDCTFHGKLFNGSALPVNLPELQDLTFGGMYSGSAFLGHFGELPPGQGGLNMNGGLFFMWHSHNEKEMTNFDIFPGGMMTFVIIEPPGIAIP
jgi:FtsP/CotA-like multicopper oxidase with cupredoxin domain